MGIIKDDVAWSPCLGRGVLDSRAGGAVELCTPFAKRNIPGRVLEGGKKTNLKPRGEVFWYIIFEPEYVHTKTLPPNLF